MNILDYMRDHLLLLDGGMGSLLQAQGLAPGDLPERWNISHPQVIVEIQKEYFEAGTNLLCANTFGANPLKFDEKELEELIAAAMQNARRAKEESASLQPKWIALDVGPLGRMLKPYGDLEFEQAVAHFSAVCRLGAKHGAEVIFIETMNDSYETKAALLGAKESCALPVFVSNAYGEDGKLMTGADPLAMVSLLEGMGADAIGVNCSLGPDALTPVVEDYLKYASLPVLCKPNAGIPRVKEGKTVYDLTPEDFACSVAALVKKGVRLAGGCCGTTPAYVKALKERLEGVSPVPLTRKEQVAISSYTHALLFEGDTTLLIGERINPTGKKRFKEALRAGDMDYVLKEAVAQEEQGVHALDVNVGLPEIDEPKVLRQAVESIQSVTDLPLQIDTADPVAMEGALRCYNGKAMVNSVNGKKESMDAVFPLVKKYGGLVVALTLDEEGIPETAEGRVKIALKILKRAEEYGLCARDLIFDPLALTVSTHENAAKETLKAVELLTKRGLRTSLGVSNVSFGLPARDLINSAFFTLAMEKGLSAAIMNPYSSAMMDAYRAYNALSGRDRQCVSYISYAESRPTAAPVSAAPAAVQGEEGTNGGCPLGRAIEKGLKEEAARLTLRLLEEEDPLAIIEKRIVPALDRVGKGYEEKRIYLPGLLISAETAGVCFDKIKERIPAGAGDKCAVVIATVKGDIHDIGKNIVRLLLENYGFAVYDLGKDVSSEEVLEKTLEVKAPLVGLSALMTTTVPAMEQTVRLIHEKAPFARVMVGGAVLTPEYASMIGADFYAKDAMEGVRYAEEIHNTL